MNRLKRTVSNGMINYKGSYYLASFFHLYEGKEVGIEPCEEVENTVKIFSSSGFYRGLAEKVHRDLAKVFNNCKANPIQPPKTLRISILEMIAESRAEMTQKEGHVIMNPHSLDEWATRFKELSKDIELSAIARQDIKMLNQALELATLCTACIEEHLGHKIDELMPAFGMQVEKALEGAQEQVFDIKKNTGDAATSPA